MTVGLVGVLAAAATGHAASRTAAPPRAPETDALVIAGHAVDISDGPHRWTLSAVSLAANTTETFEVGAPTVIAVSSGGLGTGAFSTGDGRWHRPFEADVLMPGIPVEVASGAAGAAYVAIAIDGAGVPVGDQFDAAVGVYDLDLYGDVVEPGELPTLPGSATGPTLVVVLAGSVEVAGQTLGAGAALAVDGTATANNTGDDAAVVLVATLSVGFGDGAATSTPTSSTPADGSTPGLTPPATPTTTPPSTPTTAPSTPTTPPNNGSVVAVTVGPNPTLGPVATPPVLGTVGTTPLGCIENGTDSDGDGLTDCEEQQFGFDPHSMDSDNDWLSDQWEFIRGCDPHDIDTDGDTVRDGEDGHVTFPLDYAGETGEWCNDPNAP